MSQTPLDLSDLGDPAAAVEFLENLLESSTEYSIIATDLQSRILLWNEGARRLYGYGATEAIGRSTQLLNIREDVEAGLPGRMVDGALANGNWGGTVVRLRKDGTRFTARAVLTPRRDREGQPIGFLLISKDISEEVRLATELRRTVAALEAANSAKDGFLASMSHELRTPLNSILGFSGTLLMELPGPLNDEQRKQLATVEANGQHLLSIINELLDLARIESGKVDVVFEPVSCAELLDDVAGSLRPLATSKGLELAIEAPAEEVILTTDRRALSQILINLANNAIKFTESGSVTLRLERSRSDQVGDGEQQSHSHHQVGDGEQQSLQPSPSR
ncbi:MAG TPA: histidine kinase dimerization/phospho-acceptor domain-containing protein [Solirubrobacteraceae bacterium]